MSMISSLFNIGTSFFHSNVHTFLKYFFNSVMSLTKSFFELTAYMADDEEFGEFWKLIYEEYKTTKRLLLKIADHTELMENYPDGKASIEVREDIVLPLLTIQQYALKKIQEILATKRPSAKELDTYQKWSRARYLVILMRVGILLNVFG